MGSGKASNKSGKPGTDGVKAQWDAAAKGSGGNGANKPVQTSLLAGHEVITVTERHEITVPVSEDEARLLNAKSTDATAKAVQVEAEVKSRKETMIAPLEAQAKSLRKEAETAAKEAAEHKRTVMQNVKVEYHLATATVRFFDPETGAKVMLDRAMTPAEMTRLGEKPLDPPEGPPIDASEEPAGEASS